MTENCGHQDTMPDDEPRLVIETSGKCCASYELRVFKQDDPDTEAAPSEVGELGGRGASLMLGYFDDQAATEAAFNTAGWFMTGDLGWLDEAGYLYITGRKKDVIIRGGRNIYPARMEAAALHCAGIDKAAAFAVADPRLGERVCLAVVATGGSGVDPGTLLRHLSAAGLAKYDLPEFILPLAEMPLTASGKIVKRELARRVADGKLRPIPVRDPAA
jgi:acyl-CoA synthetase